MSASPTEDESQPTVAYRPAELGLRRGRRVLAGCLLAGLLVWTGRSVSPREEAPPQVAKAAASAGNPPVALRPAAPKRSSKSARSNSRGSLRAAAIAERAPALSAPPLVTAILAAEPQAPERPVLQPAEVVEAAPRAAEAVEPEADGRVTAEPAIEIADDGNGEVIASAIAAEKRAAVQACFERELKQTPTLTGTLVVELDLAPPHRVDGVRVTDDLERPAFTQCISSTMEHLSFVALNEEVSIRVPYVLRARAK